MKNKEPGLVPADVEIGDILYNQEGDEYEFIGYLDGMFGEQPCVRIRYDNEYGMKEASGVFTADQRLYREPPTQRRHEKIKKMEAEFEELAVKLAERRGELMKLENEVRKFLKLAGKMPQVRHVIAFIENRISFVVVDADTRVEILTWPDFCGSGYTHLGLYAVTYQVEGNEYRGRPRTTSQWRCKVGKFHGEGWADLYPCENIEEAKQRVAKLLRSAEELWRDGGHASHVGFDQVKKILRSFPEMEAPEGFVEEQKKRAMDILLTEISNHEEFIANRRRKLEELEELDVRR